MDQADKPGMCIKSSGFELATFQMPSLTNIINKFGIEDREMYRNMRQTYQHKYHRHQVYIQGCREWTGSLLGSLDRGLDQDLLQQEAR